MTAASQQCVGAPVCTSSQGPRRRLLVLSCSERKSPAAGRIPAIFRYDGPAFRVLRRFSREHPEQAPDVVVLSAKYHLIRGDEAIECYDSALTTERAVAIRADVLAAFSRFATTYSDVMVCVTRMYRIALEGWEELVPSGAVHSATAGRRGEQLAQLRQWLWETERPVREAKPGRRGSYRSIVRLSGKSCDLRRDQVLALAAEWVREAESISGRDGPRHLNTWYVTVGRDRVAPKWLASKVFDLPRSAFDASEARRALTQLGLQVHRIERGGLSQSPLG